jgi:hypothetical protein
MFPLPSSHLTITVGFAATLHFPQQKHLAIDGVSTEADPGVPMTTAVQRQHREHIDKQDGSPVKR